MGNRASDNNRYMEIIDDITVAAIRWTGCIFLDERRISTHSAVNVQMEKLDKN